MSARRISIFVILVLTVISGRIDAKADVPVENARLSLTPRLQDVTIAAAKSAALVNAENRTYPTFVASVHGAKRIDIGSRMGVLVDESRDLGIDQILALESSWHAIDRPSPNFGFTNAAHWFRFQIDNTTGGDLERLIELPIPFINDVRLYHFVAGKLVTNYDLGNLKPFRQRVIKHQNFVMPLMLSAGHNMIVMRLVSTGTVEASLRIWEPSRFSEFNYDEKVAHGALAGVMIVMILYNLFIYFAIRDISYLFYIGFVASYLMTHFSLTGYTYAYVWPESVKWNTFAIATLLASSGLFVNLFAVSFLKLKDVSKAAYNITGVLAAVSAVVVFSSFFLPYHQSVRMATSLSLVSCISAVFFGYWLWYKGMGYARYFCIAWSAFFGGALILLAQKYGMIPSNFWTLNAVQIGIVVLVLLLSLTLADQINLDRKLRIEAQSRALEHELEARRAQEELLGSKDEANRLLEQRVAERTRDLNSTLDQLTLANNQLQLLSTTDGLTQVSNRAFFDKALRTEHRRALRANCAICIIIFDIDHFKRINDTYGHIGGDECLRALAKLMKSMVTRTGDVLARYGGEEFVVMLIDPDEESSLAMAEEFRAAIQELDVPFADGVIKFTASFGVACIVPDETISPTDVLACADKALYQSKLAGRNCVSAGVLGGLA